MDPSSLPLFMHSGYTTTMRAVQMKINRQAQIPEFLRPDLVPIRVVVPQKYFDLELKPQPTQYELIEVLPEPLNGGDFQALMVNPLLSHLSLLLTAQQHPFSDPNIIMKAVAVGMRDEFAEFAAQQLWMQQQSPLLITPSAQTSGGTSGPKMGEPLNIYLTVPWKAEFFYTVVARNGPVDALESEGLMMKGLASARALVITGQEYNTHPIEVLYKAVAKVFKPATREIFSKPLPFMSGAELPVRAPLAAPEHETPATPESQTTPCISARRVPNVRLATRPRSRSATVNSKKQPTTSKSPMPVTPQQPPRKSPLHELKTLTHSPRFNKPRRSPRLKKNL